MSFNPFTIIKSLLIKEENTLSPKQIEIVPGGTASTKTTLVGSQTTNKTLTLPDATDTLVGKATTDVLTNKSIDADTNAITNIENADIKVGAAIDAAKIHDGSVSNTEFGYLDGVTSSIQTQLTTNATDIANHISDAIDAHDASAISNVPAGTISATDVQSAINELDGDIQGHITDASDAHDASAISNIPSGNLVATDVQGALNEIQSELDSVATTANNAANKTLSNLTSPTAVNQDILPDASSTRDLGSASAVFAEAHVESISRDTSGNLSISTSSGSLSLNPSTIIDANNKLISNVLAPSSAGDAANKEYVDSVSAGLDPKEAVRVASTVDVGGSYATTPSNGQITGAATSIDGVSLSVSDRVLLKDQSDAKQNGIYVYTASGEFTRAADMDGSPSSEVSAGNYTFTTQGTVNSATGYVLTGNGILTLNTDNLNFTQFSGGSSGASRYLDNLLSPTAVNQNLIFNTGGQATIQTTNAATSQAINITSGSGTTQSGNANFLSGSGAAANSGTGSVAVKSGDASGTGVSGLVTVSSGASGTGATGQLVLGTGNTTTNTSGDITVASGTTTTSATGTTTIKSGNSSASNSGNVVIDTGTAGGTQGKVQLSGRYVEVTKPLNIVQGNTAIPVTSQHSITINSGGEDEGLFKTTLSDSTVRTILTAGPQGLSQAPNLISGGDAEGKLTSSTSIFTPYADAASAIPVDGTGGSPNVTSAVSATLPLTGSKSYTLVKDAANRQGQGWTIDFSVPIAHRARVQSIKFDYLVSSGTFVAGTSSADSDVTVWIYDVTNSTIIQPSSYKLLSNSSTIADQFQAEFQTSSNSTTYRLIFHISTTSASAYTLMVDNIVLSPSQYVFGTPTSDPINIGAVSLSATGTALAKGTIVTDNSFYYRDGKYLVYTAQYHQSAAGTTGTGEYRITLPGGLTADTAIVPALGTTLGTGGSAVANPKSQLEGGGWISFSTSRGTLEAFLISSTTVGFVVYNSFTDIQPWGASAYGLAGGALGFSCTFRVPISGWSSSVQMADQTSTRVVAALISGDPASATSGNPIIVPTIGYDSHSAYNATTGRYTCPAPGIYKMYGALQSASSATTLHIYKNAVSTALAGNLDSNGEATYCAAVNCNTGDIIDIRPGGTVDATSMTLNIERLSGPSQIAASELILAKAAGDPASASSGNPIIFPTVSFDTHGAYNSTTGRFSCPISGYYRVSGAIDSANSGVRLTIYKNASIDTIAGATDSNGEGVFSGIVSCLAGDLLDIRPNNTLDATSGSNINFERLK